MQNKQNQNNKSSLHKVLSLSQEWAIQCDQQGSQAKRQQALLEPKRRQSKVKALLEHDG